MSDSLWPHGLQHARLLCPLPSPRLCSNSCLLTQWWLSNISIFLHPLLLLPSVFPSIRFLPMSWLFTSDGQSIGASALAIVLSMKIQGWFLSGLIGWPPCSPSDSQEWVVISYCMDLPNPGIKQHLLHLLQLQAEPLPLNHLGNPFPMSATATICSCLWLRNILLYICTTSSLSIPLLMDVYVASMSWLL